jgi:hypothetical protein
MTRRPLDFRSFDDVAADVARLASTPHDRCGNWDLARTCDHLALSIEAVVEDRPVPVPPHIKLMARLIGPMMLRHVLKTRKLPNGVKGPASIMPADAPDLDGSIVRLNKAIEAAKTFPGLRRRHPLFGPITLEQWKDATLIHCAHHLSFLVPKEDASNAAAPSLGSPR